MFQARTRTARIWTYLLPLLRQPAVLLLHCEVPTRWQHLATWLQRKTMRHTESKLDEDWCHLLIDSDKIAWLIDINWIWLNYYTVYIYNWLLYHHRFKGGDIPKMIQNVSYIFQGVFEGGLENVSLHFEGILKTLPTKSTPGGRSQKMYLTFWYGPPERGGDIIIYYCLLLQDVRSLLLVRFCCLISLHPFTVWDGSSFSTVSWLFPYTDWNFGFGMFWWILGIGHIL